MKVSFDFDSTLDKLSVQEYAKELLNRGFEVWICTSRLEPRFAPNLTWNDDLFLVSDSLGINRENIIFCNHKNKYLFLNNKGFLFHVDDDNIELSILRSYSDVIPIFLFGNRNWKSDCEKLINEKI